MSQTRSDQRTKTQKLLQRLEKTFEEVGFGGCKAVDDGVREGPVQ